MVKTVKIGWGAWYYPQEELDLDFPDNWDVQTFPIDDAPDITNTQTVETAIQNPIGTPPLRTIAAGKKNAVLVVEDISRPTKCASICEAILHELNIAGIPDKSITLIGAVGAHRPMTRGDYIKKVGLKCVERINIENHHPYENLIEVGQSKLGTPIFINKTYYHSEVKIAISSVVPHPLAGFGGGAKIILPGISGIETLAANHQAGVRGIGVGLGFITDLRKDIEDVCSRVGLDFSVNVVSTANRGIAGLFAGHYIDAHRCAVALTHKVYRTSLPKIPPKERFTAGLFNLYPEDTELSQALKGINSLMGAQTILHRKAAIIFSTAASEGRGYHSLLGETGGKLFQNWGENILFQTIMTNHPFAIFSPNVTQADIRHFYPDQTQLLPNSTELIKYLENQFETPPKLAIFPSSIQLLKSL